MPLLLALLITLLSPLSPAWAFEVTVVQSSMAKPYQEVHNSFSQELRHRLPRSGLKAIASFQENSIYLTKDDQPKVTRSLVLSQSPDLIVAIGQQALAVVSPITTIPIITLLVAVPERVSGPQDNILNCPLTTRPGQALKEILQRLPKIKRIGVVYDPSRSGSKIKAIKKACPDLLFIERPISNSRYVIKETESLAGKIDLLLMVPDITAVTPLTESTYILFSLQQRVPLVGFTAQHLKRGATFAYVFDFASMGNQAAALASKLKKGTPLTRLKTPDYAASRLLTNEIVAKKLGLQLPKEERP